MGKTENQLKYENYKEQFQRLNSALKSGFNLEAMFIEYAIMEDIFAVLRSRKPFELRSPEDHLEFMRNNTLKMTA